jgi:hypothetical protein
MELALKSFVSARACLSSCFSASCTFSTSSSCLATAASVVVASSAASVTSSVFAAMSSAGFASSSALLSLSWSRFNETVSAGIYG